MSNNFIFTWAEKPDGKMVHVDSVPNGIACGCICPYCHERLLARHGSQNTHGFAHHSDTRRANLKICYMVILYKLAEQIIQTKKRIHVPSYYDIFPETNIEFVDVKVNSDYEREDKQPDVIATTKDGKLFLIEFIFKYKVQHKQPIDYKNLNCLEIDISKQTNESIEKFLLEEKNDRKWLNNQDYFDSIELLYKEKNEYVTVKDEDVCKLCEFRNSSICAQKGCSPLIIENSGQRYRICKSREYAEELEKLKIEERKRQEDYQREQQKHYIEKEEGYITSTEPNERTCFMCSANNKWMNNRNPGYANCGAYGSLKVPKKTPPNIAKTCKNFKLKRR